MLLALLGAAGGVVLAWAMLDPMRAFLIKALARGADIHLNWTVLAAAIARRRCRQLAASLYPALRLSGIDPNRALKAGGSAGTQRGQHRLRSGFVITQVALTLLLAGGGRYADSRGNALSSHRSGLRSGAYSPSICNSSRSLSGRDVLANFYQPLLERVADLPGVRAAGLINMLPIESWGSNSDVHIAGQPPYPPNQEMLAENRIVSNGYFDVLGIPLHRGRMLSPSLDVSSAIKAPPWWSTMPSSASSFRRPSIPPRSASTTQRSRGKDALSLASPAMCARTSMNRPGRADYLIDEIPVPRPRRRIVEP
jgi:putative ABC transport system permease protein